jgi:diguanylate cyclase (GGDEF)-like protein
MKDRSEDFRERVGRVLPLGDLPRRDRSEVARALETGVLNRLADAAYSALSTLERGGALQRFGRDSRAGTPPAPAVRRATAEAPPGPVPKSGIARVPRSALPLSAPASLDQVRGLLRLDDQVLFAEPGHPDVSSALAGPLARLGRQLLGTGSVRFVAAGDTRLSFAPDLARSAIAHPDHVLHCADARNAPSLADQARGSAVGSVALAAVGGGDGPARGHLEVLAATAGAFSAADLAMVALLADHTAGLLGRASRLEKLVFIDSMTSVYNRAYFDLQLENEIARADRESESMALCIADIDDFKAFNTTYGYEAGNAVLTQVAHAFKSGVRPFDSVARWGGEEFCVLLTAPVLAGDVRAISERLRNLVNREKVHATGLDRRAHAIHVTVSIGVALFPEHGRTPQELWRAANHALLRAKRPPKNQVVFYADSQAT